MAGGGSKKGERRGGRKKGTPNRVPALLKDAILKAAEYTGEDFVKLKKEQAIENGEEYDQQEPLVEYLMVQSVDNPVAFMTLMGKVLPMQVTGEDGGPIKTANVFNFLPVGKDD